MAIKRHIAVRRNINLINWKLVPLCGVSKEGDIGYEIGTRRVNCKPCLRLDRKFTRIERRNRKKRNA